MPPRVLIAQFMHETNTFSKLATTLDDYRRRWLVEGDAMMGYFKGTRNEVGGYIDSGCENTAGSRCSARRPMRRPRAS